MSAKNIHHDIVVNALIADGWQITHDPLTLSYGGKDLFVDLGAERDTIAAEKEGIKIAVEIQSFISLSPIYDLESAVGQYDVYRSILAEIEPNRILYLAIPQYAENLFSDQFGQLIVKRIGLKLIIFSQERIMKWMQ